MVNGINPLLRETTPQKSQAQLTCEAQGGRWDGTSCIMPTKKTQEQLNEESQAKKPLPGSQVTKRTITATGEDITNLTPVEREARGLAPITPIKEGVKGVGQTFTQEGQKRPSGLILPDGRTFFGLSPDEIAEISEREGITSLESIGEKAKAEIDLLKRKEEIQTPELLEQLGLSPKEKPLTLEEQEAQAEQVQSKELEEQSKQVTQLKEQGFNDEDIKKILSGELKTGTLTPITAGDVTDAVTLFSGLGFLKFGTKFAGKQLTKQAQKQMIGKSVQTGTTKSIVAKTGSVLGKMKNVALGLAGVGGLLNVASFLGVKPLEGKIGFEQQAINTLGETSTQYTDAVRTNRMHPLDGIREVEKLEQGLIQLENAMEREAIASVTFRLSGEFIDVLTDIQEKKLELLNAKSEMRQVYLTQQYPQTYSTDQLNQWLADMETAELQAVSKDYQNQIEKLTTGFGLG